MPEPPTTDEFHRLLGQVVEVGAKIEFNATVKFAYIVSHGDTAVGLLVLGGESITWIIERIKRFGDRFPDQAPGLSAWAIQCAEAFRKRNRVIHDWFVEHGEEGERTALQFAPKIPPVHLKARPRALGEIRIALEELLKADREFTALMFEFGERASKLDSAKKS